MEGVVEITGSLVIDLRAREWCKLRYPNHPKGCPNYGRSERCPPKIALVHEVFDLSRPHWFVVEAFDLEAHVAHMRKGHPNWTDRQCRNCLYWQGGVRKRLREKGERAIKAGCGNYSTQCAEAMGVHVIKTAQAHGIPITRAAFPTVYKIALVGFCNGAGCVAQEALDL